MLDRWRILGLVSLLFAGMCSADGIETFNLDQELSDRYKVSLAKKAGDFLFIGGIIAYDFEADRHAGVGDPAIQMAVVYEILGKVLQAHGVDASHVVSETLFYKFEADSPEHAAQIWKARSDFYEGVAPPTNVGVTPASFYESEVLIELQAIAYLGE